MGRTPDAPALQKAKGFPGKRPQTVKARLAEQRAVAKLLADAPSEGDGALAPPAFLDQRFPVALRVWRQLAPKLKETHRLPTQHRLTFAMLCVYFAEWVSANEDIAKRGHTQLVETTVGGFMERVRPIVKIREIAFSNVMVLSDRFGLTPSDEYAIFKDQRISATNNPGLFDDDVAPPDPEAAPGAQLTDAAPQSRSLVGGMSALDSVPPQGVRPN